MQLNIDEYDFYVRPGVTDMRKRATGLSRIVQNQMKMVAIAEWSKNHRTDPLAKCGEQPWEWHPYPTPALWEQITVRAMTKFHILMNAIILALESVGCGVTDDFHAVIGDEKVRFGAFETRERVLHDPEQWKKENPKSYYYVASTRKYDYRRNGEINFYVYRSERSYYC